MITREVRWGRAVFAGLLAPLCSMGVVFTIIFCYAMMLGFKRRGPPDGAMIARFASQVGSWGGPALTMLLAFGGALWVARGVGARPQAHGLVVGAVAGTGAALVGLSFNGSLSPEHVVSFLLALFAGWLGGVLGGRARATMR